MSKIKLQKIVGNLLDLSVGNCTCEWNDHSEIFSCPQAIENFRQFLLVRTDISQKTVVDCP